jgi:hypothetical protein
MGVPGLVIGDDQLVQLVPSADVRVLRSNAVPAGVVALQFAVVHVDWVWPMSIVQL